MEPLELILPMALNKEAVAIPAEANLIHYLE